MASGPTASSGGRGGKGFDFGTDDILCSYEDYGNHHAQDPSNGSSHSDPTKDFHKSRISRSSVFPTASYGQPEDSFNQEVVQTVERSMKRHTDNLMRFLEGISSRLSQLELYCYNLDKSIGEMRTDLIRDHGEADTKLKFLEKHLQEVHRSVQILRDKQELADTQKELAKLQLAQKESSQSTEEKATPPATDNKKADQQSEVPNQQLALALPHQVMPQQQQPPAPPPSQAPPQTGTPQQSYYAAPPQLPQAPSAQPQYLSADSQYRAPQMQDVSRIPPQPPQMHVSQHPSGQQYPQYQQQWSQQLPQQGPPPQQPSVQPQMRPPSPTVYSAYPPPGQPQVQTPEPLPNSMPMQVTYSTVPQPISGRADVTPYGYGTGRPAPQQATQQVKNAFGAQQADAYVTGGPHLPPGGAYMIYDGEGGRHHQPQPSPFAQGVYPSNPSHQNPQTAGGANMLMRTPSPSPYHRNHPYRELTEKLVNMGFRGDQVVNVIQRMEESGQPVDFNAVLDRLSMHSSGASQRGWSG